MRVLITGGTSGLGAALASACVSRGDAVTVIDVAAQPPELTRHRVKWLRTDLSALGGDEWEELASTARADGPFDLVVLNAGISATGRFEEIDIKDHLRVSGVNLHAALQLASALHRTNAMAQDGRLVFISSLSYFTGYPGAASYAASKDGLVAFARSLRKPFYRSAGICVQVVCPGPMDTAHATRYAPKGSSGARRLDPVYVARCILAARRRQFWIIPGTGAKLAAIMGQFLPALTTRLMGRVLFAKLKHDVRN